jgi:hypothetical protein
MFETPIIVVLIIGDCCSSMVGLSLTDAAERIAANVAKLPVS